MASLPDRFFQAKADSSRSFTDVSIVRPCIPSDNIFLSNASKLLAKRDKIDFMLPLSRRVSQKRLIKLRHHKLMSSVVQDHGGTGVSIDLIGGLRGIFSLHYSSALKHNNLKFNRNVWKPNNRHLLTPQQYCSCNMRGQRTSY